jgi:hypothetical protein
MTIDRALHQLHVVVKLLIRLPRCFQLPLQRQQIERRGARLLRDLPFFPRDIEIDRFQFPRRRLSLRIAAQQ